MISMQSSERRSWINDAIRRVLPMPTPLTSPSTYEALLIQQRSMSVARDDSLSRTRATGDWESVGQVIARLRR